MASSQRLAGTPSVNLHTSDGATCSVSPWHGACAANGSRAASGAPPPTAAQRLRGKLVGCQLGCIKWMAVLCRDAVMLARSPRRMAVGKTADARTPREAPRASHSSGTAKPEAVVVVFVCIGTAWAPFRGGVAGMPPVAPMPAGQSPRTACVSDVRERNLLHSTLYRAGNLALLAAYWAWQAAPQRASPNRCGHERRPRPMRSCPLFCSRSHAGCKLSIKITQMYYVPPPSLLLPKSSTCCA